AIKIKMDQLNTTVIRDPELEECVNQLQEAAKEIRIISHELKDNKITELNFVILYILLLKTTNSTFWVEFISASTLEHDLKKLAEKRSSICTGLFRKFCPIA